jgi:septation ring formation regulator EzrA
MSDVNNSKSSIADKIYQAVSSMLDTEVRLNHDLNEARDIAREQKDELDKLYVRLEKEQAARKHLENLISQIGNMVGQIGNLLERK